MTTRRAGWVRSAVSATAAAAALLVAIAAGTQEPAAQPDPKAATPAPVQEKEKEKAKVKVSDRAKLKSRGLRAPGGGAPPKALRKGGDPLANAPAADPLLPRDVDPTAYHFEFKLGSPHGPLAAAYYSARGETEAPCVLLIHERGRSQKDFQELIPDLKKKSLAEALQADGFAVLAIDLPGQGGNTRRELQPRDWPPMAEDLQAAYKFLLDRHNHGELNLARLGVVAVGEGANLAALWAATPGAAVAGEERTSDLAALVLISPMVDAQSQGLRAGPTLAALASRVPLMLMAGERDHASIELVNSLKTVVTRSRLNKVEILPTALHGYRLLRLEPKAASTITRFFEGTTKFKADPWEPRYNLTPVAYTEARLVRNGAPAPAPTPAEPAPAAKGDRAATRKAENPATRKAETPAARKAENPATKTP